MSCLMFVCVLCVCCVCANRCGEFEEVLSEAHSPSLPPSPGLEHHTRLELSVVCIVHRTRVCSMYCTSYWDSIVVLRTIHYETVVYAVCSIYVYVLSEHGKHMDISIATHILYICKPNVHQIHT